MDEEKRQFDATIGGAESLPPSLHLSKFASSRSEEVQTMRKYLSAQSGTKLAFQTLPKHMRRRTMSHNVKRLPQRLRQIHLNQMKKSGMPAKQKRPSRKYRRRPKNLVEEYSRRGAKKFKWLPTHIWHAKRFHIIEKYGWKVPCYPRDKAFRACYRATARHCLIQDLSYFKTIEIKGDFEFIIARINKMVELNTGLSFKAKIFINGAREGEIFLHNYETRKAIGSVNFIWHSDKSKLWLSAHPAFYEEILENLIKLFELSPINPDQYINNNSAVIVSELWNLCRLRLTGPLSNSILHDSLILYEEESTTNIAWLEEYLKSDDNIKNTIKKQNEFWKSCANISSQAELPPHMILSLLVRDPRLNMPKKRTKITPEIEANSSDFEIEAELAQSPLWDERLRAKCAENKLTNAQIAQMRSNLLVPGSDLEGCDNYVPILVIQRPGSKSDNTGFCSGWDVILTSDWVLPFWLSFVQRGARSGGLREFKSIRFEMAKCQFLAPDTKAGAEENAEDTKTCVQNYFKRPPNNRTNYNKYKIASPFSCDWRLLIRDWSQSNDDEFSIIRDRNQLRDLQNLLKSKSPTIDALKLPSNSLIPVKLTCEQKGTPNRFAIICLAKHLSDFKKTLFEPNCVDIYEEERKKTRNEHKVLLKKLRKQRKLKKSCIDETHAAILSNYTKKMRSLWLPLPTNIKNSCSRQVIGFVEKGGFSLSLGKSSATGYIAADAITTLIQSPCRDKVLIRNTNSKLYRSALIDIIVD